MTFLAFVGLFAVILSLAAIIAESKDVVWPMWVILILAVLLGYIFYGQPEIGSTIDLVTFVSKYAVVGLFFALLSLIFKTILIKRKLKNLWQERPEAYRASVENEVAFINNFARDNGLVYYGSQMFSLEAYIAVGDVVKIKTTPHAGNISLRLFNWASFWPFFAISFIFRDILRWFFDELGSKILVVYRGFLNSLFNGKL